MNAQTIARHYAMLACGGALDGVRILSSERIDTVRTPRSIILDEVIGGPGRFGLGYALGGDPEQGGSGYGKDWG